MSNDFYNHATYPAPNSAGSSAAMRAELELIKAGFDKMPTLAGNGYKVIGVNPTGTALISDPKLMNVDFSTSNVAAGAVGRLTWNDTDGTLDLGLKGGNVTLQIGQEQNVRIYNETATGFVDMQVVKITGSSGTRLTADLAKGDSDANSASTIAIMTEPAASHGEGFATTFGLIRQVDTSAFTEGAILYLSPTVAGGITTTRPTAPNHTVILGWCVRSHATQGMIYVNINNGYEIDELHDVLITSVANNNMLRYNSSSGVWQNIAGPAGAVVGTTDTQTLTNKTISGGTVTGAVVTGLAAPSASSDAVTKSYADTGLALKLNLAGGTMSGAIAMGTNKITGLGDPTAAQDAATKAYVDTAVQGLDAKASVRVATTANITLSGTQTVDGIALSVGDRVLVKDQSTAANNGIYLVSASTWTRTTDADTWAELVSAFVFVEVGTTNGNNGFTCTVAAGGTLGSTAVTWVQFSGAGQINAGTGLTKTGNTLNVGTASSARIVVNSDDIDLATTGVTAGSYGIITVDAYGRATGGSNPTTLSGYGITNAYTKTEVDTFVNAKLNLAGGTMTGDIAMGGNKVTGLGAPTTDNDAVRLIYVTTLFGSTSSAASSAAAALVSQNAAAASASAASTSEGNALTSKNAAATSATNAATSETNAASSAASAAASYDSFDDRYLGPKSTAPAVDNDGNALLVGALYFDTTLNSMRVYDGSVWMSAGSSVNGTSRRYKYVATAAQTTFTGVDANGATMAYDPGYLDVYLNGSRLDASDYTANSGSSIVLGVAASVNDELNIVCFGTFAVATHVLKSGDTMTGQLTVPTLAVSGGTANGVAYLNGSKVVTTGSALQFDGTNLGLGTTPSAWTVGKNLQLGAAAIISGQAANTSLVEIGANWYYGSGGNIKYINSDYASDYYQYQGKHVWWSAASGTAGATATTTIVMTQGGIGNTLALQGAATVAGIGISFPSSQLASSDANTLDDYEEGSWTPIFTINGTDSGATWSAKIGKYVKVGKVVYLWAYLYTTSGRGSGTGPVRIESLPFACEGGSLSNYHVVDARAGISWSGGGAGLPYLYMPTSNSYLQFYSTSNSTSSSTAALDQSNFSASGGIEINVMYMYLTSN